MIFKDVFTMKTNRFGKKWKAIGVLLVFVLLPAFSGCGRKAPPEPPESGSLPAVEYAMSRNDCHPVSDGAGTRR